MTIPGLKPAEWVDERDSSVFDFFKEIELRNWGKWIEPDGIDEEDEGDYDYKILADEYSDKLDNLPPRPMQDAFATEIEAEQALVSGNRDLIARFENKIDAAIARVWGETVASSGGEDAA